MKKRMKQLAALLVAAMLVLGGCSEKQEEQAVNEIPETEAEAVQEPEEAEEEPAEEVTKTAPLKIHVDTLNRTYYQEDSEDAYLYLQYCNVTVEGDAYENLKRNIENWSLERSEELRSLYSSFEEPEQTDGEETEETEELSGYNLYQTVSVARSDERMVSLLEDTYQYTGGAHGVSYREGINFDSQSGKRLELQDIFSDYENFKEDAIDRIVYNLKESYGEELFEDYIETVEGLWENDMSPEWYADGSGIVIVLQEYSVGPYSIGTPEIHLPYSEFQQYIKEAYLPGTSEGTASFEENQEIYLKLPGTEEEYPMMLQCERDEEDIPSYSLWLGQNEKAIEVFAALKGAYLVKTAEEVFCLVEVDQGSDDGLTYVYRLTDGVIEEITQVEAAVDRGNINPDGIVMKSYVNLLGTYEGVKTYQFDDNGGFSTTDTEYVLHNDYVLTTKTDLSVTLEGAESTLPSGSHIILNGTDNETYVTFTIQETGQTGVLNVQRGEDDFYNVSIDGMNENDCFEILPYAG